VYLSLLFCSYFVILFFYVFSCFVVIVVLSFCVIFIVLSVLVYNYCHRVKAQLQEIIIVIMVII
jgi:hypothetical protein